MPPASSPPAGDRATADAQDLVTAVLTASRVLLGVAVRSLAEVLNDPGGEAEFEFGLATILDGIEARFGGS